MQINKIDKIKIKILFYEPKKRKIKKKILYTSYTLYRFSIVDK